MRYLISKTYICNIILMYMAYKYLTSNKCIGNHNMSAMEGQVIENVEMTILIIIFKRLLISDQNRFRRSSFSLCHFVTY